jgi:hypothetical protein
MQMRTGGKYIHVNDNEKDGIEENRIEEDRESILTANRAT